MRTPILESERIILRPVSCNDAKEIYEGWTSDPEVAKYMIWDVHESIEVTIQWLKTEEENINNEHQYNWGFVLKETGELFGTGGIHYNDDLSCFELGYNIMKKYWGQGLTTEASRAILEFAVSTLGEKRFFCRHAVDNIGSQKVMTKLGFQYYGDSSYISFSGKKQYLSKDYYLYID